MQVAEKIREPAQINAVALKAYARVADAWGLSLKEAAGLADMSESTWKPWRNAAVATGRCRLFGVTIAMNSMRSSAGSLASAANSVA